MDTMSAELRSLLTQGKIEQKIIKVLETEKCLTVASFAEWFDEPKEWTDFVKSIGDTAPGQAPALKSTWKTAGAIEDRRRKRKSDDGSG